MSYRYQIGFAKNEQARYIGHLDLMRAVERAIRRSHLPMAFSEGFHPHMKMNFSTALSVGMTSEDEYLELELREPQDPKTVLKTLIGHMPRGIELHSIAIVSSQTPSLMSSVHASSYRVDFELEQALDSGHIRQLLADYGKDNDVVILRQSRKGEKSIAVMEYLRSLELLVFDGQRGTLTFTLNIFPGGSIKPVELIRSLVERTGIPIHLSSAMVTRTKLYTLKNGKLDSLLGA